MKTLVIANQKGGVGKSTLTTHLAYAAREQGKRVLLVDLDKQGSLSMSFPGAGTVGLVASQLFGVDIPHAEPEVLEDGLAIVRADAGLLTVDQLTNDVLPRPREALRRFDDSYDLCLIDTPPLLGVRLIAGLAAADFVVTPISIGMYELAGLGDLMQTIQVLKRQGINQHLRHIGFVPVNTNTRSKAEREGLELLRKLYRDAVLIDAMLPSRAAVKQAVAARKPVWQGTRGGGHLSAAVEWQRACSLILKRLK